MQNESASYSNISSSADGRDTELWQMAKRRAALKISAFSYVTVNCFLIAVWYFTSGPGTYFWPIWPILGWGIGVLSQYFHSYHGNNIFSVENEYQKLKNKQL